MKRTLSALVVGWAAFGTGTAAGRPRVLPYPKEMTCSGETMPLRNAVIVLGKGPDRKAEIGAEELNKGITGAGGAALPVDRTASPPPEKDWIVVGTVRSNPILRTLLRKARTSLRGIGEQGYLATTLKEGRNTRVLLAGVDPQGALYACVTACFLVKNGVEIYEARIRDWPDYKERQSCLFYDPLGTDVRRWKLKSAAKRGGARWREVREQFLARAKKNIDRHLRYKCNGIQFQEWGGFWRDRLIEGCGGEEGYRRYVSAIREATDYGWDRGFIFSQIDTTAIAPKGETDPVLTRCVTGHDRYYCWANDTAIRKRVENLALACREMGYRYLIVHNVDGGGHADPEKWSKRCEQCKRRWGDDRVKATVNLLTIWDETFKRIAPAVRFDTVQYPYSVITDPAHKYYRMTKEYFDGINRLMPPGVGVCVRENTREKTLAFYEAFPRRRTYFYWMPNTNRGDHRMEPFLSARVAQAGTFYAPSRRDYMKVVYGGDKDIAHCIQACFIWNVETPGAYLFEGQLDPHKDGIARGSALAGVLLECCAEVYGEEVAPLVAEAFYDCISPAYIADPSFMKQYFGREIDLGSKLMFKQKEAVRRARAAYDRLFDEMYERINPERRTAVMTRYDVLLKCDVLARYQYTRMKAEEDMKAGKPRSMTADFLKREIDALEGAIGFVKGRRPEVKAKTPGRMWRRLSRFIKHKTHYSPMQHEVLLANLNKLLKRATGTNVVLEDTEEDLKRAVFIFKDGGEKIRLGSRYNTKVSVVEEGFKGKALRFGPYERTWDGPRLRFAPLDIGRQIAEGGSLRFYVNADPGGEHQPHTFWLTLEGPGGQVQNKGEGDLKKWVRLQDFVDIDPFPDTWQLASIPLARLCGEGMTRCTGLSFNFTREGQKPICFSRIYVIGKTDPVPVPYAGRAARLTIAVVARSLSDILSGAGTVSQLRYEASIDGAGALRDAVFVLHLRDKQTGEELDAIELVRARVLDLPWTMDAPLAKELRKQVSALECVGVLKAGGKKMAEVRLSIQKGQKDVLGVSEADEGKSSGLELRLLGPDDDGFCVQKDEGNRNYLRMGGQGYYACVSFPDVRIPIGARIRSATLKGYFKRNFEWGGGVPFRVLIHGEDADSGEPVSKTSTAVKRRKKTVFSQEWEIRDAAEGWRESPDVSFIVRELVDRPGWRPGNRMNFIFNGGRGTSDFVCAETDKGKAFRLSVRYALR